MQQPKCKDSVAVRSRLSGSEVSVSCFLLQAGLLLPLQILLGLLQ